HAPAREVRILADIDSLARITGIPAERGQHLVVQDETWVEAVWNAAPAIQVQRNIEHAKRCPRHCPWRQVVGASDESGEIMVVLSPFERVSSTIRKFQCSGLSRNRVDRSCVEVRPMSVFFVIAAVEVPTQVKIQTKLGRDLDV